MQSTQPVLIWPCSSIAACAPTTNHLQCMTLQKCPKCDKQLSLVELNTGFSETVYRDWRCTCVHCHQQFLAPLYVIKANPRTEDMVDLAFNGYYLGYKQLVAAVVQYLASTSFDDTLPYAVDLTKICFGCPQLYYNLMVRLDFKLPTSVQNSDMMAYTTYAQRISNMFNRDFEFVKKVLTKGDTGPWFRKYFREYVKSLPLTKTPHLVVFFYGEGDASTLPARGLLCNSTNLQSLIPGGDQQFCSNIKCGYQTDSPTDVSSVEMSSTMIVDKIMDAECFSTLFNAAKRHLECICVDETISRVKKAVATCPEMKKCIHPYINDTEI